LFTARGIIAALTAMGKARPPMSAALVAIPLANKRANPEFDQTPRSGLFSDPAHQDVVIDMHEEFGGVNIHHPVLPDIACCFRQSRALAQSLPAQSQRGQSANYLAPVPKVRFGCGQNKTSVPI
jgi:hypothetical protein